MLKEKNFFIGEKADELVAALGGVCAVARICEITTPSVSSWRKIGVPRARLMYLKLKFPDLPIWQKYAV